MGGTLGRSLFQLAGVAHAATDAQVHLTLKTAKLTVTVTDQTGTALQGVSVEVVGTLILTTGADGKAVFAAVPAETPLNIKANKAGYGPVTPAGGTFTPGEVVVTQTFTKGQVAAITMQMQTVTVTLTLAQPVACPGHPLAITAKGTPAGGTYTWTVSGGGGATLTVSGGGAGDVQTLLSYAPDAGTGNIPAQTAAVSVTYTLPGGQKGTANQNVTIHGITFTVTNNSVTKSPTVTLETAALLNIGPPGPSVMYANPTIKIQLDASCPRKPACAASYRVGWLQTAWTNVAQLRYTDSLVHSDIPSLPCRDALSTATPPFYGSTAAFTADGNSQSVVHGDNPGLPGGWTDPRPGAPPVPPPPASPPDGGAPPPPSKNLQLRTATRAMTFTAWLVAQNTEWAAHDVPGSLAFLGNFDWGMNMTVTVDTTKAVGSRATPASVDPAVPGTISTGKGGKAPNLAALTCNQALADAANYHMDPAPTMP